MGGATEERKRRARAEGSGEERKRGDLCTRRIKMLMATYPLLSNPDVKHLILSDMSRLERLLHARNVP